MNKVRVARIDEHNFGIQMYKQSPEIVFGKANPRANEWEWHDERFYGHRLEDALKFAVLMGMDNGEVKESLKLFAEAMATVPVIDVKETKACLGRK